MKATIKRENCANEFYTDERCFITELSNSSDDPALSIARARVEPGVTTAWHRLDGITERYSIISGNGTVEVGELPAQPVSPGDVVIIPPGYRQRISNSGSEDLIFLALCTPRFVPEAYRDLESSIA